MQFGNYETKDRKHPLGGTQHLIEFPNGYGASIIHGSKHFRAMLGTYEVAVTKYGALCYTTPITDDVMGHRTAEEVAEILHAISLLPDAVKPTVNLTWVKVGEDFSVLMHDDRPVGYFRQGLWRARTYVNVNGTEYWFSGKDALKHARLAALALIEDNDA